MSRWPMLTFLIMLVLSLGCGTALAQYTPEEEAERAAERLRSLAAQQAIDIEAGFRLRRYEARLQQSSMLIEQLETRHAALNEWMDGLLTNEDGKRLALKDTAGVQYLAYMERPLLDVGELDAKREQLNRLLALVNKNVDTPQIGFAPTVDAEDQADDLFLWARDRLARVAENEAWLRETLAEVDLDADVSSLPTLQQRIDGYRASRFRTWLALTDEGRRAADEEAAPQIAQNAREVELERALFEAQRFRKEAELRLAKERIDSERRDMERDADHREQLAAAKREYVERLAVIARESKIADAERGRRDVEADIEAREIEAEANRLDLVARCRSAAVLRDLKPFLDEGVWQPGDRQANLRIDPEPMSWSALSAAGALNPDADGWKALLAVANVNGCDQTRLRGLLLAPGGRHADTARTKWSYNRAWTRLKPEEIREVRRIQQLLIELGPTLVEEGMLAP